MRRHTAAALALLACTALPLSPAHAQPPGQDGLSWSLGPGILSSPEPYVGADNEVFPVPLLTVDSKRFFFQGIEGGLHLIDRDGFTLDALASIRFQGYEADDSPFLEGMEDRDDSLDLGLEAAWEARRIGFSLKLLADALSESDGQEATAEVYFPLQFGRKLRLEPGVAAVWQSDALVDHYYGVRPVEARPGRPAYEGPSTINGQLKVQAFYFLSQRWMLVGFARLEALGSEIEDSPIVEDSTSYLGFLGVTYRFR